MYLGALLITYASSSNTAIYEKSVVAVEVLCDIAWCLLLHKYKGVSSTMHHKVPTNLRKYVII